MIYPQRFFPRAINKEQKLQKETKYRFKVTGDYRQNELADVKSRKDFEIFKEGERLYNRFNIETGSQDPEYEKEIDRMIDDKIKQGLDDDVIIDQIVNQGRNTMSYDDYQKEEDKFI